MRSRSSRIALLLLLLVGICTVHLVMRAQARKDPRPVAMPRVDNVACSCQLYGVHKNGTKVGALLYTFNDSLPDDERDDCAGWCRFVVNATWKDGDLFLKDPMYNKSIGQQICESHSQTIASVYVGLFVSCFSQLQYTGLKSKMRLCCYSKQQVACPENPAAAVVVSDATRRTTSTSKPSAPPPPHLRKFSGIRKKHN
ncbi:uncharacterized protein LOC8028953 [Ixodes scapularis]|uniref:uncharacterized protein LOC8028953 n=1 Tax=Ixodes scapularis TaxID=6945 RepID=UPI001A9E4109|nr:uncharacterized protein LOC8028953 [Ixodes scapularis]